VVTRRRRGQRPRPAYVPRRCDHCRFDGLFPSRTAFRNHLRGAHGLYLSRSGRYIRLGCPDAPVRVGEVPPAPEPRPTPITSGPAPSRLMPPATAQVQPTPVEGMQFPASRPVAPRALMGISAFPLVAEWRRHAACGRDTASSAPAEADRQPSPPSAQELDVEALGPSVDLEGWVPLLLLEGEHGLTPEPGHRDMDVVAVPDAAVCGPMDTPVPADLASPLLPAAQSVQRADGTGQRPPRPPVAVCPPESEPSESHEGVAQADWAGQVTAEELSGDAQVRRPVVPEWANLETPPVSEVSPLRASPAATSTVEVAAISDVQRPELTFQVLLDAIRPFWLEGIPAHSRVVDNLLSSHTSGFSRAGLISSLRWMFLQRRDVGLYLGWCLDQHQATGESPADTLQALREFLSRVYHAPVE